jgi:hypothetical protein
MEKAAIKTSIEGCVNRSIAIWSDCIDIENGGFGVTAANASSPVVYRR